MTLDAPAMPVALLPVVLLSAELLGTPPIVSGADSPLVPATPAGDVVPGQREHRCSKPPKRDVHELRDPSGWPAEPAAPTEPPDAARFDAAVVSLCAEVAPDAGLEDLARVVREAAAETHADAFLLAALTYQRSRCRPGLVSSAGGVGLLQIEPAMFAPGATLPFPREDLARDRLLDPAHNLRVGAALLGMWEANHVDLDRALGSTPHRTAVAHLAWGDRVWGAQVEDRTLTARRRLLEAYARDQAPAAAGEDPDGVLPTSSEPAVRVGEAGPGPAEPAAGGVAPCQGPAVKLTSPLEGEPRLGISGPGEDRDDGRRVHRGLDIDAAVGEPVRAVADGVVQFAGADLRGRLPARELLPSQLQRWRHRTLGPGGFFVRIMHDNGVRTGYFHLHSFSVVIGQVVHAGEVIGRVGLTGVRASESHLHFEVHENGELGDPVRFLSAFVLPPADTINHDIAIAWQRQRLARARRHHRNGHHHRLS
jgi:murein DD-endopeptidase MepM/ murein hydrolase activator NlpD